MIFQYCFLNIFLSEIRFSFRISHSLIDIMNTSIKKTNFRNGFWAIAVGVVLLGTGPIFVKTVNANGLVVGFYRMLFGGIILTIPALARPTQAGDKPGREGWLWVIGGCLTYGLNLALWCTALNFTTASAVTLLDTTAPVWVGLFGFLFLGKIKK